jgi:hypothetical protein
LYCGIKHGLLMKQEFKPFTSEQFNKETGLNADEHEGVYLRWVNANINYQNYLSMSAMKESLHEIIRLLREEEVIVTK